MPAGRDPGKEAADPRLLANRLLNSMTPKTAGPRARYQLAIQVGVAMGLCAAGHRADARKVLEKARTDAVAAKVARALDAVIAAL